MAELFAISGASNAIVSQLLQRIDEYTNLDTKWVGTNTVLGCTHSTIQIQQTLHNNWLIYSGVNKSLKSDQYDLFERNPKYLFADIHGPFCVLAWHHKSQTLQASRDPLNQQDLYFAKYKDAVVVSNSMPLLKAALPIPLSLNKDSLAHWLGGQPNPELSMYNEIQVLKFGAYLQVSQHGHMSTKLFWDIDPHQIIRFGSDIEYQQYFTYLLTESTHKHMGNKSKIIASQMSGGLDSTSITAIANNRMEEQQGKCIALSHVYTHSDACNEAELIAAMQEHLHLNDTLVLPVDEGKHRDFMALYPTHMESPGTVLSPRYHQELAAIANLGATTLLTGSGGDEMCWGHASAYTQRLQQGEWKVIAEVYKACKITGIPFTSVFRDLFIKPFIPEALLNLGRKLKGTNRSQLPQWLSPEASQRVNDCNLDNNPFDPHREPMNHARYHGLKTTSTYNSMRSYRAVADQYGITVAHPFFDARIAEFSFAIPPNQLIRGPYPKWLLRNAMKHLLPKSVCWNLNKVTFDNHFGQLVKDNAAPLRELLQHRQLEELGLLDTESLLNQFDAAVAGKKAAVHVDLLYAILTQRWLQQHGQGLL
jgi:asparagine synthetase B (glutamine-hydrolysing)